MDFGVDAVPWVSFNIMYGYYNYNPPSNRDVYFDTSVSRKTGRMLGIGQIQTPLRMMDLHMRKLIMKTRMTALFHGSIQEVEHQAPAQSYRIHFLLNQVSSILKLR